MDRRQPGVRDSIYGPGFQDWNISLFKTFALNERSGFEFRAEAYDFPNHPNLSGPNYNPTSSQFGEITSKTELARNLQLSLRFYFCISGAAAGSRRMRRAAVPDRS